MDNKNCYLILAHRDPGHLKRLIYALDAPGFDIYVHVDKRMNVKTFGFEEYELKYGKLVPLKDRVKVYWGDYSVVSATLRLFRAALQYGEYKHFVILSGLDYPIAANGEIRDYLEKNEETELFNAHPETNLHKFQNKYFLNHRYFSIILQILRKRIPFPILQAGEPPRGEDGRPMVIYFAPEWNALTDTGVKYILDTIQKHPEIPAFFKHTYAPDELMIPSILMNSPLKDRVFCGDFDASAHYNEKALLHYLDYGEQIAVFTEKDYDKIIASGKLFLRKAVTGTSDGLMDLLDKRRESRDNT